MGEPEEPSRQGWTFLKVLGLIVGVLGMVGFGTCSLCGVAIGLQSRDMWGLVLMFAGPGLVIAILCFFLVRKILGSVDKPPP